MKKNKKLSHQEKKLEQKTNLILMHVMDVSQRDPDYPFTRDALAEDQYGSSIFQEEYKGHEQEKRREFFSVFDKMGKTSIAHAARRLFGIITDAKKSEEERLQSALYLTQIAFLMAEVSGIKRKDLINTMMNFYAQESSLKSIQDTYLQQYNARKIFLSPEVIQSLRDNARQS